MVEIVGETGVERKVEEVEVKIRGEMKVDEVESGVDIKVEVVAESEMEMKVEEVEVETKVDIRVDEVEIEVETKFDIKVDIAVITEVSR